MAGARHFIEAIVNPFFVALVLLTLAIIQAKQMRCSTGLIGLLSATLLLLLIISTGFLPKALTDKLEHRYPVVRLPNPAIHWVVVLSGGQADMSEYPSNTQLYGASLKRLIEGVRLYRALPDAKLLLSGGGIAHETPEAVHMAQVANWFAIPVNKLLIEKTSLNTIGQVHAIKSYVKEEPFYLVTSAIHMTRAMEMCVSIGLKPIPAPTDYTFFWQDERWEKMLLPNPKNMAYVGIALHELLGMQWALLWHQINLAKR